MYKSIALNIIWYSTYRHFLTVECLLHLFYHVSHWNTRFLLNPSELHPSVSRTVVHSLLEKSPTLTRLSQFPWTTAKSTRFGRWAKSYIKDRKPSHSSILDRNSFIAIVILWYHFLLFGYCSDGSCSHCIVQLKMAHRSWRTMLNPLGWLSFLYYHPLHSFQKR